MEDQSGIERKRRYLKIGCWVAYLFQLLCIGIDSVLYITKNNRLNSMQWLEWSIVIHVGFWIGWLTVLVFGLLIWISGEKEGRFYLKINGIIFLIYLIGQIISFLEIHF